MAQLDTVSQNNSTLYERMEMKQRFFRSALMTASIRDRKNQVTLRNVHFFSGCASLNILSTADVQPDPVSGSLQLLPQPGETEPGNLVK